MKKQRKKSLQEFKATIGQFQDEVGSNKITDFVVWLECKAEYAERVEESMKKMELQQRDMLRAKLRKKE